MTIVVVLMVVEIEVVEGYCVTKVVEVTIAEVEEKECVAVVVSTEAVKDALEDAEVVVEEET